VGEELIDLSKYRIIDLSVRLTPGVHSVNQEYVHGRELRKLEIRQFIYKPDNTFMHWVETETHIGTHVEAPAHYIEGGKAACDIPLDSYMGPCIVLKFDDKGPVNGKRQVIIPNDLKSVQERDIVLLYSKYGRGKTPYISEDAARFLTHDKKIKMVGIQGIGLEEPGKMESHDNFLKNDTPIIEVLTNLDKVKKERVFFIGLPLNISHIDSSWIRAIALEEL